jgi:hypothetical protein
MWHEVTLSFGILPLDAFVKQMTVGGSYTLHFNDRIAWEVVRSVGAVAEFETHLMEDLQTLGISPTPFDTFEWAVTTSLAITPFQISQPRRPFFHTDWFLLVGGGYGGRTVSQNVVMTAGMGVRTSIGRYMSLRFDCRWEGFFNDLGAPLSELWISLGVSYHVGRM